MILAEVVVVGAGEGMMVSSLNRRLCVGDGDGDLVGFAEITAKRSIGKMISRL